MLDDSPCDDFSFTDVYGFLSRLLIDAKKEIHALPMRFRPAFQLRNTVSRERKRLSRPIHYFSVTDTGDIRLRKIDSNAFSHSLIPSETLLRALPHPSHFGSFCFTATFFSVTYLGKPSRPNSG